MNNKFEEELKYCHANIDPKENLETTPPFDEKIKIPSIWVFEVFPPEYIENFDKSIEKLGWGEEKIGGLDYFQETLHSMRHQNYARGWINLGYIVDESNESIMSGIRKGKLPEGVKQINASIFQPIPSTTILICQFLFQEKLANNIEKALRKKYNTYIQKNKKSVSFISTENQKRIEIQLELEFLNGICCKWMKEKFHGLYASSFINENHPVCNLITLEKNIPFEKNDDTNHYNSYLSILNLNNIYEGWIDKSRDGLYLTISSDRDSIREKLILSYNEQTNKILSDKNIKMYGDNKASATLNSLTHSLDNTLGTWVLHVLLNSYSYKINDLRDLYGKSNKKSLKQSISTLSELDYEVLQAQKNIIPFISEMKHFCKDNFSFMHNIKEFIALENRTDNPRELFKNIKSSIKFQIELLEQNQKMLKETSTAVREVNGLLVSDKIAETNIKLQKSIKWMTIVILILTCITTYYSLPDDKRENITSYFQNLLK
ncbi:hypothetical protein AF80_07820 [Aliarcobacter butzleri L355]|uniref:Uncharacterized protein n=1 Tax=Aliarcobacter butzleri L355 TaxID=1447263 RepID=A0A0G9KRF2_9BACT|nr:hypothetical protein [Aliarcobacter butzleri]KLE09132.1 hypothetical protein AF80_07820 [Aliarcobacter butzleri L355]